MIARTLTTVFFTIGAIAPAMGHVNMMWPPSRIQNPSGIQGPSASVFPTLLDGAGGCQNFACLWFNQGCQPGCKECTDIAGDPVSTGVASNDTCSEPGGTMEPTLNDMELRTYNETSWGGDWTKLNPWRSPGHAPIFSPCGLAGGGNMPGSWMSDSLTRHMRSGATTPPFIRRGLDARDVPESPKTTWKAGAVEEVAWSIFGNSGGGYSWRLCKKTTDGNLSEECFQNGHLEYAEETSYIQYGSNVSNRTAIPAKRTRKGTFPAGSPWTKNPIPPCADEFIHHSGGPAPKTKSKCTTPMFKPALPGLFGDGPGACITWAIHGPIEGFHSLFDSEGNVVYQAPCTKEQALDQAYRFQFNILDKVKVPADLAGEFVLSFRLDSEQTPAIWSQCSDITITA